MIDLLYKNAKLVYEFDSLEMDAIRDRTHAEVEKYLAANDETTAKYTIRAAIHRYLNTSQNRGMSSSKATKFMAKKEAEALKQGLSV